MGNDNWDTGNDYYNKSKLNSVTSTRTIHDNWDTEHKYDCTISTTEGRTLTMEQVMNSNGEIDADPDTILQEGFISPSSASSIISQILQYAGEGGVLGVAANKIDENSGLLDKSNSFLLSKGDAAQQKKLNMEDIKYRITEVDTAIGLIDSSQIASDISNFNDNLLIGKKKAKLKKYQEACEEFNNAKNEWESETFTVRSESSKPHKLLDLGLSGVETINVEECYRIELEHISYNSITVTEDEWHGNNAVTKTKTYYDHTWTKHKYKYVDSSGFISSGAESTTDPILKTIEDRAAKVGLELPCQDAIMNIPM